MRTPLLLLILLVPLFSIACTQLPANPKHDQLDLEAARQALIKMAQSDKDPEIKAVLADLSLPPDDRSDADSVIFSLGVCKLNLTQRTWTIEGRLRGSSRWTYSGKFQKTNDGMWQAVLMLKGEGIKGR